MSRCSVIERMVGALCACLAVLAVGSCTPTDAQDLITPFVEDCLDADGCGSKATLDAWNSFQWYGTTSFGVEGQGPALRLIVVPGVSQICPPVFVGEATVGGVPLEYLGDQRGGPGCPVVTWALSEPDWPETHAAETEVVLASGETELRAHVPFSLTRPRSWQLVQPATPIVARGDILVFAQDTEEDVALPGGRVTFWRGEQSVVSRGQSQPFAGHLEVIVPDDISSGEWEVHFTTDIRDDVECEGRAEHCSFNVFNTARFDIVVEAG